MAAATQQSEISKVEPKLWELRPSCDVMDFVQRLASFVSLSASLTSSSITRPDSRACALPLRGREEPLMLGSDSTLPARISRSSSCSVSAARRTKSPVSVGWRDSLCATALGALDIDLPALGCRTCSRSQSISTRATTGALCSRLLAAESSPAQDTLSLLSSAHTSIAKVNVDSGKPCRRSVSLGVSRLTAARCADWPSSAMDRPIS